MKKQIQTLLMFPALLIVAGTIHAQTRQLSLQEALQEAARGNRNLQIQYLKRQQAHQAVQEARSFLLPNISANAGYLVYGERPVIYLRDESATDNKVNDVKYGGRFAFDGNISASYPLLNPALQSAVRSAGIQEQIQQKETKKSEEQLALNISSLYLSILMNQEQQSVLQQSLARNEIALKDARSLFLQGKNLKTDTLSNYISVQNLTTALSALQSKQQVMLVQLKQFMGIEDSTDLQLTDSLAMPLSGIATGMAANVYATASDMRKDIHIQSLKIEQAKEQQKAVNAVYKPQLWAVAGYQIQSQTDDFQFWQNGLARTSYGGVKLSIPIYSGNRQKIKSGQAAVAIKEQELALAELKSSIKTELTGLQAELEQAYRQLNIQQKNVDAAQVNYNMMSDRYHYGLGTRLEFTDAELGLTKAKLEVLQSVFSIRLIELQIKNATGILHLNN